MKKKKMTTTGFSQKRKTYRIYCRQRYRFYHRSVNNDVEPSKAMRSNCFPYTKSNEPCCFLLARTEPDDERLSNRTPRSGRLRTRTKAGSMDQESITQSLALQFAIRGTLSITATNRRNPLRWPLHHWSRSEYEFQFVRKLECLWWFDQKRVRISTLIFLFLVSWSPHNYWPIIYGMAPPRPDSLAWLDTLLLYPTRFYTPQSFDQTPKSIYLHLLENIVTSPNLVYQSIWYLDLSGISRIWIWIWMWSLLSTTLKSTHIMREDGTPSECNIIFNSAIMAIS